MTAAAISAAAAPVWASAAAARAGSAGFAGSSYDAYRAGVRGLLDEGVSLAGRLDTVALAGEPAIVLSEEAGGIVHIELPAQPNGDTGYRGYVDAGHVGSDAEPEPVRTPAGDVGLASSPADAETILAIAMRFEGVPYLWGGVEGAGIDCSGLIHIAARIGGRTVPRDAHHQWAATRAALGWGDLVPGDILYFGSDASLTGIDHVGFYAGDDRMLHAPETGRVVVLEPLSRRARERSVAFGRLPSGG